jgi:hypothetical protein
VSITRTLTPRPRHIKYVTIGLLTIAMVGFGLFAVERLVFRTNNIETNIIQPARLKLLRIKRQAPKKAPQPTPAPVLPGDLLVG